MKATYLFKVLAILVAFNASLAAQSTDLPSRENVVQVLVPIRAGEYPGAAGSHWKNELWIHNANDVEADVFRLQWGDAPCPPHCGGKAPVRIPDGIIPPHTTKRIAQSEPVIPGQVAELLYVDRSLAPSIHFELRTHDEARNSVSAGTELPVVDESAHRHHLQFLAVPISPKFRYMLRIYYFPAGYGEPSAPEFPRIRFFDVQSGALLADSELLAHHFVSSGPNSYEVTPYPNEIPLDLAGDPRLAGAIAVRMEVDSPHNRLWGFLSLTNNTSHEVTVVSPWSAQ